MSTGYVAKPMTAHVFDHLKSTYFEECAELLECVYTQLAALEDGREDRDTVHAIFRAVHSIKGGGGAFGFARMVGFAHGLETLLDLVRDSKIVLDRPLAKLLLRATDALSDLISADREGRVAETGLEDGLRVELASLVAAVEGAAGGAELAVVADALAGNQAGEQAEEQAQSGGAGQAYCINFRPHLDLFKNASEPLLLIRELGRLGHIEVRADITALPALDRLDPESAYIAWVVTVHTAVPMARLYDVFEFVADQCDVAIAPMLPPSCDGPAVAAIDTTAAAEPSSPVSDTGEPRRAEVLAAAPTVRVDVEKIDRLVNLVGELVINQTMLVQLGAGLPAEMCPGLTNGLDILAQHLRELQDGVMAIRTQPVRSVFSRMPRLLREVSALLGKDTRLVMSGESTEIDKTVIEHLADPLTHLLRNALDHGIETPAERVAAGKPAQGIVHLGAEHRGGRIIIEVADDGRGIDGARVLARARARGLIAADKILSDDEIIDLIFLPGFSTMESVSNISGRGVGMDVVRRNILALGGRINVHTVAGQGSRFVLSLPLTLAILDGMIVAVGADTYIVPLANIVGSLRPARADVHAVAGHGDVLALRGAYVPLLYLAARFGVADALRDAWRGIVVVVENESAGKIGLVVDDLIGQQQVVVKSLEANYGPVSGVGGATILGNGRVALILDVAGLCDPCGASVGVTGRDTLAVPTSTASIMQ